MGGFDTVPPPRLQVGSTAPSAPGSATYSVRHPNPHTVLYLKSVSRKQISSYVWQNVDRFSFSKIETLSNVGQQVSDTNMLILLKSQSQFFYCISVFSLFFFLLFLFFIFLFLYFFLLYFQLIFRQPAPILLSLYLLCCCVVLPCGLIEQERKKERSKSKSIRSCNCRLTEAHVAERSTRVATRESGPSGREWWNPRTVDRQIQPPPPTQTTRPSSHDVYYNSTQSCTPSLAFGMRSYMALFFR